MTDIGVDRLGFVFDQGVGSIYERASGIDDVVHQNAGIAGNVTDHVHYFGFTGPFTTLVDDGQRRVDALCQPACTYHAADIGRNDHHVVKLQPLADVPNHHRRRIEVIGRDIEKSLDLTGVQVQRHDAVCTGTSDKVGDELRGDWRSGSRLAILAGVTKIRNDRRDAARGGASQRVDYNEQLHQVIVGRKGSRLDHENVRAAYVLLNFDENFHVREPADDRFSQRKLEIIRDAFCQRGIGIAGDELDRSVLARHL